LGFGELNRLGFHSEYLSHGAISRNACNLSTCQDSSRRWTHQSRWKTLCPIPPLPSFSASPRRRPLTSPTPPLPWGEEGIKKKLFWSFSPLSLGERGAGGVRGGGVAALKGKATAGSEIVYHQRNARAH